MMRDIKHLLGNKKLVIIAAIIYSGLITILFLMPSSDLPRVNLHGGADKAAHFLIHFIFVFLWQLYFFRRYNNRFLWRNAFYVLIGSLVYGIIIEILQGQLTDSRTSDYYDVLANLGGAVIAVFVFQKLKNSFTP